MVFYIIAVLFVVFVYVNVLGMFAGYKNIPEGKYKEELWKFKKMEIIEKGVISVIMAAVIISMNYTEEIAGITLIAMILVTAIEVPFGNYIKKNLKCPECGGPVWTGKAFVIIKPRRICEFCGHNFYVNTNKR